MTARLGVRWRLGIAAGTAATTWGCILAAGWFTYAPFTLLILGLLGATTLTATIALVLGARQEEIVHRLANDKPPALLESTMGHDGEVSP